MRTSWVRAYIFNSLILVYLMLLILFLIAVNARAQKNQPKEQINVEKEFDEMGNVIRYDSTYFYSFSGTVEDFGIDSLFRLPRQIFFYGSFPGPLFFNDIFGHYQKKSELEFDFFLGDEYFRKLGEIFFEEKYPFPENLDKRQNLFNPESKRNNSIPVKKDSIPDLKI